MGIRGKLALLVPGLIALTVVGVALFVTDNQRREQTDELRARHELLLESIGVTAAAYVAQNDMAGLDALVAHISQARLDPDLQSLTVLSQEGRILADSEPTRFNEKVEGPFVQRALASERAEWETQGSVLRISVPARAGLRWATVVAEYSLARVDASHARTRTAWLLGAAGLGVALCLILSAGLIVLVIRPVRTLQKVARRMGEGDLDAQVPPLGAGELGELGTTFNKMAAALKAQRDNLEHAVAVRTAELKEANERLEKLAVTDGLTGVFNHRRFQESLNAEAVRSARTDQPFSVVMVDVDHFKAFNDSLGHPAGDELLRRLARTLKAELRQSDFLARYGGEEFAIILPATPKTVALQAAERLRQAVWRELDGPEWGRRVSISLGVATWGDDGDQPESLLIAADKALYFAKRAGRNRVVDAAAAVEKSA